MDKTSENPDEDIVSLRSNGEMETSVTERGEKVGMLKTLRKSFRRVAEKSPLLAGSKEPKVTVKAETGSNEPWSASPPPPSPSEYEIYRNIVSQDHSREIWLWC